ncbi:MAG TPA: hypothetical protein VHT28_18820, partial [Silvibacterium sp.]|nr:hypothetical protein [Silvibacterium sp.]
TQRARVKIFHMPPYSPPWHYILLSVVAISLLIVAAYALPLPKRKESNTVPRSAPAPRVVGMVTCALGLPWTAFVLFAFGSFPTIPFLPVLVIGLAWATFILFLMWVWTSSANWHDAHRYALVFGGVLACMLGGYIVFKVSGALRIDWIGKAVLNVAAAAWLISLARSLQRREGS